MRHSLWLAGLLMFAGCAEHGCSAAPSASEEHSLPALRTLRRGEGNGPVVVILHGMGSRPEDMVSFAERTDLPEGTRFVFPYAPTATHPPEGRERGFIWWSLGDDFADPRRHQYPAMEVVRRQVIALLDSLEEEYGVSSERIVLGGFSQGAMLAMDVALHDPRPFAGVIIMSGTFVDEASWMPLMAHRRNLRVFQSHGRQDDVLLFGPAEELSQRLLANGVDVRFFPFEGRHQVNAEVSERVAAFVREVTEE